MKEENSAIHIGAVTGELAGGTTGGPPRADTERLGLALGALGVLIFSFTLPATKAAVPVFGGWVVGIGRAVVAGLLSVVALGVSRTPLPGRRDRWRLLVVAAGVVVGFPVLTAVALQYVPATRGAVVVGLLPGATAVVATLRHGERPSARFWLAAAGGLVTVVVFAVSTGPGGRPEPADVLLGLAVAAAAVGYAEGAAIGVRIGGWQTISWALVLALPVTLPVTMVAFLARGGPGGLGDPTAGAVLGLVYVSVFSMFLGFFAWYAGLGRGGVARVSQIQLLQPVLTLVWASLLLGERLTPGAVVAATVVTAFVVATRRAPVGRVGLPGDPGSRP